MPKPKEEKEKEQPKEKIKIDLATCTCGWHVSGKREEIEGRAVAHGLVHKVQHG